MQLDFNNTTDINNDEGVDGEKIIWPIIKFSTAYIVVFLSVIIINMRVLNY